MCGICGFTGEVIDREVTIKNMTDVITHRGPDSNGYYIDDDICMGFLRLSIIDLENGSQPIFNEDKSLVLTFNGEIYNYKELRSELLAQGHTFYTEADSEVLVHAFEQWQEQMLNKLRGMFAFAIFNKNDKSIFMARDFFGIKPLHYYRSEKCFAYASEIKSILKIPGFEKKLNYRTLDQYLSFQYAPPPETFFEDVYCLLPGHYMWYKDSEIKIERYFDPVLEPDKSISLEQAVRDIEEVFEDSVNAHKISDVEVGCFLSSGVDSSYVSTYFKGQKTFSVGFDFGEKYNEISWAKELSEKIGVDHHYKVIKSEEFWSHVPKVQYHMDQPLADPSCIALYFVANLASQYVKVALSGEGADELFGGYTIYHEPQSLWLYQTFLPKKFRVWLAKKVAKRPYFKGRSFIIRGAKSTEQRFIGNAFMFGRKEKQKILKDKSIATRPQDFCKKFYDKAKDFGEVEKMQYIDLNLWLVGDILLKADRMSMANSLEVRVPFLDKHVYKVASRLPTKLKVNNKNTKYAMRMAALKHLPEKTAQKKKLGFPVPTRVWLKDKKYYNIVKRMFNSARAGKFFNRSVITSFLDAHYNGKADNSRKIWTIYVFLVWYGIYFENDGKMVD
ncbi:MAG: asparagine synthase (glutamine-hydrolyzing) [Clostridia bacterium]|nr:asparagine synthase (glutamine-hydrolyzing) [Clostridia bacterium]